MPTTASRTGRATEMVPADWAAGARVAFVPDKPAAQRSPKGKDRSPLGQG